MTLLWYVCGGEITVAWVTVLWHVCEGKLMLLYGMSVEETE